MATFASAPISSNSIAEQKAVFTVSAPPFPADVPRCLPPMGGEGFDPSVHLQIEPPKFVKDLSFNDVPYPYSPEQRQVRGELAYTQPFRVLSDEGVRAARRALAANEDVLARSNPRAMRYVRGLGYTSLFHHQLAYDPTVTALVSDIARDSLGIHSMPMNISHTNIGAASRGDRPVDKWHTDSTDYVMVIMLSDVADMEGGDLKVLQMADATGDTFQRLIQEGVPDELVQAVRYSGPGYCVLMQGSKILHKVDAVLRCREPRMSLVNSYMTLRPFSDDRTKYATFTEKGFNDPAEVAALEFTRHKAWRAMGKLQFLLHNATFDTPVEELIGIFQEAAGDCQRAAALLRCDVDDNALWVDDKAPTTTTTTTTTTTITSSTDTNSSAEKKLRSRESSASLNGTDNEHSEYEETDAEEPHKRPRID